MKKRSILSILLAGVLLLCGCSANYEEKGNTESEKNDMIVSEVDTETESEHVNNTETESEVSKEDACEFEINLPEGAILGEVVDNTGTLSAWKIDVEGYNPLQFFPYGEESSLWISAGWIEVYDGEYGSNGNGFPYIPWNHCEFYNHTNLDNAILCEVEFEVYSSSVYAENGLEYEDGLSHFWCLIFEKTSEISEESESNWIFLNKECFTKEQAISIAKNYVSTWETGDVSNALAQEKLDWFQTEFFNAEEDRISNMFLTSEYETVADINLGNLFYGGANGFGGEVSKAEENLLADRYDAMVELDIAKTTVEEMNTVLKKYTGLTLEEANKVGLDALYYLEEYKAYYNVAGDTMYLKCDVVAGWTNEDGTITLQYTDALSSGETYEVALKEVDGGYQFISNKCAE